ncbi:uncharacterized protein LOC132704583 [Cylas formicarius]|uniref:uncharacterized protein LOC132704583 n=1 Tax=Cylas formicarius TaxID=197179 RepID=UPI0029589BB1|nr:uncharacterized protein LOC132704583 [Cylas formicarius]
MTTPEEIKAEYTSSLADLTFNSKPLINVLTMLAEENLPNARVIVEAIETHLAKAPTDVKLPILYLIDCIVKNVGQTYTSLFGHNIVSTFCNVFKEVDEKTRAEMFKLRQTWNDVFHQMKLYAIDVQISMIDPAWPVTAQPSNSIHLNPKFLKSTTTSTAKEAPPKGTSTDIDKETLLMQEQLIQKQKELLELQRKTLELEVLQTQVKLQEQLKSGAPPNILLKPEVAKQLIPEAMGKAKSKPIGVVSSVIGQRFQNNLANQAKVKPTSGALAMAKPIRDPRLLRQQQGTNLPPKAVVSQPGTALSNVRQKSAVLENNKNVNNKMGVKDLRKDPRITNKIDKTARPKTLPKSQTDPPPKTSRPVTGTDSDKSILSSGGSSSSLDSLTKTIKIKSPKNNRKREKSESPGSNDSSRLEKVDASDTSAFKSGRNSRKNRNYIRHNLTSSPDLPQDEDLRSLPPPDKQPRIEVGVSEKASEPTPEPVAQAMDVDLRQLPTVIGKKRPSADAPDQASKKSKSFDVLFGNEDTDLRQLSVVGTEATAPLVESERPPTPPPPIISSAEILTEKIQSPKKSELDAIRAKLASATNREKVMAKSFHKKKLEASHFKDQDLRVKPAPLDTAKAIIISPEDEKCIKSGSMTKEQEKHILNKIFMQIEKNKLREAKKKDHEDSALNVSLQPISDDEFEDDVDDDQNKTPPFHDVEANDDINGNSDDKSEDRDDRTKYYEPRPSYNDKDERFNVLVPQNEPYFHPRDARRTPFRAGPAHGAPVIRVEHWRGRGTRTPGPSSRPPIRMWMQQPRPKWRNQYIPEFEDSVTSTDPTSEQLTVLQEDLKTINIDGIPRDVRTYGEVAVVFLNWDDPREISFQSGTRRVTFNGTDSYYLSFGDGYKECSIDGDPRLVKLGVPTREIFVDNVGYECYFGGAPINITLNGGTSVSVLLDGPVPQVKIGEGKRTDLVAGKITLIINAKLIVPVFLDAKEQKFVIDGEQSTLKFVDGLKTVLINDMPFEVEFGGLPKPFTIHGKKHFIRFSLLPKGVKPGHVRIRDMEGERGSSPALDEDSQDSVVITSETGQIMRAGVNDGKHVTGQESPDSRSKSPSFFQNLLQPNLNNFDVISNALSTSMTSAPSAGSYQVENVPGSSDVKETKGDNSATAVLPPLNINELFQKLVASGFVKTGTQQIAAQSVPSEPVKKDSPVMTKVLPTRPKERGRTEAGEPPKQVKRNLIQNMRPIDFNRPETLKIRQSVLYTALYAGMQCSSCGMRFPPEASMLYSQHLDWHFRQNRKGKRNIRVAASRKWYYSLADWKNYEEIEDLEEREKNYFDQQQQAEVSAEDAEEENDIPSVLADPSSTNERCEVCRDIFEQFFNEEKEEWHLRNAIKMDNKTYHPVCYDDYQKSLLDQTLDESKKELLTGQENKLIPGLEIILDDDEDEEYVPGSPNDVVSLPDDDEEEESKAAEEGPIEEHATEEPMEDEDDDDDVILNEVAPIKIVVDDDDDEDQAADAVPVFSNRVKKEKQPVEDDGFVDVGEGFVSLNKGGQIKIKSEPIDPDDLVSINEKSRPEQTTEIVETPRETSPSAPSHPELVTSIDGNIELVSNVPVQVPTSGVGGNKIKINISKPLPVISQKEKETEVSASSLESVVPTIDPNEPYPPGEEPDIVPLKPGLENVTLKKLPPVKKGSELTGLCSIM